MLYEPKSRQWNALTLFAGTSQQSIRLTSAKQQEYREFLWKDLCAEFDSFNLYQQVVSRREQYSDEFISFIESWYTDETNHTYGFATIYSILYGERVEDLFESLRTRVSDFSHLEEFLADEFKLCLLLAYDELATTLTYHKDIDFYGAFGRPEFATWIRRLTTDEALHFSNLIRVLKLKHRARFAEVKDVMNHILALDLELKTYCATFVLDHSPDCVHFQLDARELSELCAGVIIRKLAPTQGRSCSYQ